LKEAGIGGKSKLEKTLSGNTWKEKARKKILVGVGFNVVRGGDLDHYWDRTGVKER